MIRMHSAVFLALVIALGTVPAAGAGETEDLAAARVLFETNLGAIRDRDRDAYLATYLESERLARTGAQGISLGYAGLEASAGEGWPEVFEAHDLDLVPVRPGVVYGTYRYRVRFDGVEQSGLSERLFVETDDGWRIAVTSAFPALSGTPPPPRALVGATLVDGTGAAPVEDAVVVLRGGRIDCAGSAADCPVPGGIGRVDLTGRWITPGLVDAHVHFSQTGWVDGRPDFIDVRDRHPYELVQARLRAEPERFYRSYLCSGVTAVFDVGGYPWTWDLRRAGQLSTEAPHVAAAGPLLSTLDFWLNLPAERQFIHLADEAAAGAGVEYLASHGSDAAKVWFIVREGQPFEELAAAVRAAGREAERRGLPLIVHATELRAAKVAVQAGAHLLVHSVWDREVDDELVARMQETGTIYCPTLTVPRGYQRLAEAVATATEPPVDDPNRCVDPATRVKVAASAELDDRAPDEEALARRRARLTERERIGDVNLRRLARAGVQIAMGTDAGNPLTLHGPSVYAEMEAMQAAGMSPMEVLVASTRGGAAAMGRSGDLGTVEAGKIADLLVLAADPSADAAAFREVVHVVRGGVLRPVGELSAAARRP
ncbi:MAG: amidohydrolase family protein [Thermoanaerobaculia bacterium]|nr:amidohydrolase family protein [Thermoanaerobaculia bacterium]